MLSIAENAGSSRVKRQSGRENVLVLIAVESLSGSMVPKATVASLIRENKDTAESIIGGQSVSYCIGGQSVSYCYLE